MSPVLHESDIDISKVMDAVEHLLDASVGAEARDGASTARPRDRTRETELRAWLDLGPTRESDPARQAARIPRVA
jgi:hypothetical protein